MRHLGEMSEINRSKKIFTHRIAIMHNHMLLVFVLNVYINFNIMFWTRWFTHPFVTKHCGREYLLIKKVCMWYDLIHYGWCVLLKKAGPAYRCFTAHPIMMTSSNGNIFRVTGHLCREFTGHRWIPHTQRPVTRGFDVFFDMSLNKQLSKQ